MGQIDYIEIKQLVSIDVRQCGVFDRIWS